MIIFGTISSVSAKGFFSNSYKVSFDKTLEQVQVRAELMDKEKTYQKHFTAKDKMGNLHIVTIYDDDYMKIDNVFYAYKFRNIMYYSLSLNMMGSIKTVEGTEKAWGGARLCNCCKQSRHNNQLYLFKRNVRSKKLQFNVRSKSDKWSLLRRPQP